VSALEVGFASGVGHALGAMSFGEVAHFAMEIEFATGNIAICIHTAGRCLNLTGSRKTLVLGDLAFDDLSTVLSDGAFDGGFAVRSAN